MFTLRIFITEENLQRWFLGNTESTISPDLWHSDQSHFYFATHIWGIDFENGKKRGPQFNNTANKIY